MKMDIESILLAFIREHCLPQKSAITLHVEDNLFDTGTIDSAGLIHFVGYIEERFGFVIPDEDLLPEKFTTIQSIADYIRNRLENPTPPGEDIPVAMSFPPKQEDALRQGILSAQVTPTREEDHAGSA